MDTLQHASATAVRLAALVLVGGILSLLAAGAAHAASPTLAGPPGGGVREIVVAPSNRQVMYASNGLNLFRTRGGGRRWQHVPQRLSTPVNLFAVDPGDAARVYGSAGPSELGERLVVSTDSGMHWRRLGTLHADVGPGWLVIDPRGQRTLYQELRGSIYRSADEGKHWRRIPLPASGHPQSLALASHGVLVLAATGLYRSYDSGRSWHRVHAGIRFAHALVADPSRPARLYALVDPPAGTPGVWRSRNGGASWSPVARGPFDRLAMDPRSPSTLYATRQSPSRVVRTTNGGDTWEAADRGLGVEAGLGPLAVGGGHPSRVYVSTGEGGSAPGGVRVSSDRGIHWRATGPGLVSSTVLAVGTAARCPKRLYASTGQPDFPGLASHLYASGDGARHWSVPATGPPAAPSSPGVPAVAVTSIGVDGGASTVAYAGSRAGVWRTSDGGRRWARLDSAPTGVDYLAADPRLPATVYASAYGVLRVSRDGGTTWSDTGLTLPGAVAVTAMAFDPLHPSVLYAATRAAADDDPASPPRIGDGVFGSSDGAATWTLLSTGLGDRHIGALALDPRHVGALYAATEGHGIYRSLDSGIGWRRVGRGPIRGPRAVNNLAVDPATSRLYAANGANAWGNAAPGLWRSKDGGRSWASVMPTLVRAVVSGIAIDATGTYLDAATYGLGVIRIPLRSGPVPACR